MTNADINVVLVFMAISGAVAALAVLASPAASGWLGKRLYVHSCAQAAARRQYRETARKLQEGTVSAGLLPDKSEVAGHDGLSEAGGAA